jgi:hypothetical protein
MVSSKIYGSPSIFVAGTNRVAVVSSSTAGYSPIFYEIKKQCRAVTENATERDDP